MTIGIRVILVVAAVVCFALATFNVAQGRLIPAGLLCWSAATLFE